VNRELLLSPAFLRAARRILRRDPALRQAFEATLELLAADAFHPRLRSHKLKGNLRDSWACSVAYDLRIIFSFVQHEGREAILLESMGSHDEVY
jgi:addiction module RelE/StbE family toxin